MGVTICELDMTKLILKIHKPTVITEIGPCKIKMTLETKEIIKIVDDDPLLQQQMVDAGQDAVESASKEIAKELKGFDNDAQKALDKMGLKEATYQFARAFEKAYEDLAEDAQDKADTAILKVWKDYVKTHKDYNKYKLKIVGKVTLGAVGVGAAVAGAIANTAIGDVPGVVFSILGAAKGLSSTLQTVRTAIKSAADVWKVLLDDLEDLDDKYDKMSKQYVTAQEVFAKAVDKFTTVSLNSVKKCETNLATFKSKLGGIEKDSHTAARDLNKMLNNAEKVFKIIDDSGIDKLKNALKGDLTKMKQGVEDTIGKVADLVHQVKEGKEDAEDAAKFIAMLKEKIDKRVYTGAALAIDIASLAGDIWGGAMETKDFEKTPEIIGNVVTCINAVQDGFDDYFKREKK